VNHPDKMLKEAAFGRLRQGWSSRHTAFEGVDMTDLRSAFDTLIHLSARHLSGSTTCCLPKAPTRPELTDFALLDQRGARDFQLHISYRPVG